MNKQGAKKKRLRCGAETITSTPQRIHALGVTDFCAFKKRHLLISCGGVTRLRKRMTYGIKLSSFRSCLDNTILSYSRLFFHTSPQNDAGGGRCRRLFRKIKSVVRQPMVPINANAERRHLGTRAIDGLLAVWHNGENLLIESLTYSNCGIII